MMIFVTLLIGVLVLVLVVMAMGPLESLGWWSDKGAEKAAATIEQLREEHEKELAPHLHPNLDRVSLLPHLIEAYAVGYTFVLVL